MLAFNVHDEHRARLFVHTPDAVEKLDEPGRFATDHRLLLLDVIVDRAIGFHLFDLFKASDGFLDGFKIGECAAQPAFSDIELAAFPGRFLDGLLGLLLGADKKNFSALAHGGTQEVTGRFQLIERFAEVNDMDAIAGIEDERLHLRIPTFGLMSEMDA